MSQQLCMLKLHRQSLIRLFYLLTYLRTMKQRTHCCTNNRYVNIQNLSANITNAPVGFASVPWHLICSPQLDLTWGSHWSVLTTSQCTYVNINISLHMHQSSNNQHPMYRLLSNATIWQQQNISSTFRSTLFKIFNITTISNPKHDILKQYQMLFPL